MFDLQTFIAILATLLLFLTSVVLSYDRLQFRNYDLPIPQWASLLLAGITFGLLVADQILRGFVRLEEKQRRAREENFRIEEAQHRLREAEYRAREENFRIEEAQHRLREAEYRAREENFRIEEAQHRLREAEYRTREENFRIEEAQHRFEERNRRLEAAERQARRTGIETRYRIALIRFQLDPNLLHRRKLGDILALLEEYQDTL